MTKSVTKENRTIQIEEYPSFGYWLKRRRKALDLTQAELARRAGCSAAMIRKIEADERRPSVQLAELLAEGLQLPADQADIFVQFARGVAVGDRTGLEMLGERHEIGLPPMNSAAPPIDSAAKQGAMEPAAPAPSVGLPHNLPAQTTPFFGRQDELANLAGFLSEPHKRLVTVLGPGGMGKTRLALAAAEAQLNDQDSARRFRDGIYFAPLAGVASADGLTSAVAEALDFQFSGSDEPQAQLLRYLAARQLLLVLDNFEHLLSGVGLVQAILDDCPGVELLVTSREKLRLRAEQLLPIGGLTYPAQDEGIGQEQAGDYSAVQLFVERTRSVRPSFELSADNLKAITAICRQVAGMPLGVVLAAAWIDTLTVEEIAREIGRDLDFLETELSDIPARQRSLQAAFNHSWRLLSPQEQAIYCQLSVFRSGFSAEAAAAVTGASFRDLQALVNKSLLSRSSAAGQPAARYGVHELLRQFAEGELARQPDLRNGANDQHSTYYLGLLQKLEPDWHTGRQLETLATITRESNNITVAWGHAMLTGAWEQLAGAMDSWAQYHHWRGLFVDGNAFCVELESRLIGVMDAPAIASLTFTTLWVKALAWQGLFLSTTEEALAKLEDSLAFLERQDPDEAEIRRLKAFVLRQMAWRLIPVAIQKAHESAERALKISLQLDDSWEIAESHFYLGMLNWRLAHFSEARESAEISLAIVRELGDRRMEVRSKTILAWIIQTEGDLASSERLRYEALDLCRRIGDRPWLIYCLNDLAQTLILRGKLREGLRSAEEAVALSEAYGFQEIEGAVRESYGWSLIHLGDYEQARREYEWALELVQKTGNRDVQMGVWSGLGLLALIPGDTGRKAQTFFERGRQISEQVQDEVYAGAPYGGLLLAACQAGDSDMARQYALDYLEYVLRIRHYEYLIEALAAVAFYLAHFGSKGKALEVWQLISSQPFIKASQWYADVVGRKMESLAASQPSMPAAETIDSDLWQTAEALLADLKVSFSPGSRGE